MINTIKVTYKHTNNVLEANKFLKEISKYPVIGCDFEVASRYDDEDIEYFKSVIEDENSSNLAAKEALSKLNSNALAHPSHTTLTHLSIAISESEAYVFILDTVKIIERVLTYLTATEQLQVWHNCSFDFKHIHYYTNKFPINYEDTQIYSKTLLNHVDVHKATTGLKELAGHAYGAWGISVDNFKIEQMFEPHVLLYSATDPCATLWVWNRILENYECEVLPGHITHVVKHIQAEYEFEEPEYFDYNIAFYDLVSDNYPEGLDVNLYTPDEEDLTKVRVMFYEMKSNPINNLIEADPTDPELHSIDILDIYEPSNNTPNQ